MNLTFFIFDDTNADENANLTVEMVDDTLDLSELVDDDAIGQEWMQIQAGISLEDQLALDELFEQDFTWEQATSLLALRNKVPTLGETYEHPSMQFARWLYTNGRLNENLPINH